MFDFHKLTVYQKTQITNKKVLILCKDAPSIYLPLKNQLIRSSTSILLNIAEGSGRTTPKDKSNFYTIAKGSAYECVSLLDIFLDIEVISNSEYKELLSEYEEIVKMLFGLIKSLKG